MAAPPSFASMGQHHLHATEGVTILQLPVEVLEMIFEELYRLIEEDIAMAPAHCPGSRYWTHHEVLRANITFAPVTRVCRKLAAIATRRLYARLAVTNGHGCDVCMHESSTMQRYPEDPGATDFAASLVSTLLLWRTLDENEGLRRHCRVLLFRDERPFNECTGTELPTEVRVDMKSLLWQASGTKELSVLALRDNHYSVLFDLAVDTISYETANWLACTHTLAVVLARGGAPETGQRLTERRVNQLIISKPLLRHLSVAGFCDLGRPDLPSRRLPWLVLGQVMRSLSTSNTSHSVRLKSLALGGDMTPNLSKTLISQYIAIKRMIRETMLCELRLLLNARWLEWLRIFLMYWPEPLQTLDIVGSVLTPTGVQGTPVVLWRVVAHAPAKGSPEPIFGEIRISDRLGLPRFEPFLCMVCCSQFHALVLKMVETAAEQRTALPNPNGPETIALEAQFEPTLSKMVVHIPWQNVIAAEGTPFRWLRRLSGMTRDGDCLQHIRVETNAVNVGTRYEAMKSDFIFLIELLREHGYSLSWDEFEG